MRDNAPRTAIGFRILVRTIFENTNKPLRDWFKVAHLMLDQQKGYERAADWPLHGLWVGYKTAWLMGHKIRTALDRKGHRISLAVLLKWTKAL